jgi:hypothetical protein
VIAGVTHKIGQDFAQSGLPFEYEWEDDGDVDLLYQGVPYEIESPQDASFDLIDGKKKHKKKVPVGMVALKKASTPAVKAVSVVAPKTATPPPLPKALQKVSPAPAPKAKPALKSSAPKRK